MSNLLTISNPGTGTITVDADTGCMTIPANLPFDQWREALQTLKSARGIYDRALRSAVDYGVQNYGQQPVAETLQQLEFDLCDARNALAYAQTSERVRALPALSDGQRFVIARKFPDDVEKQQEWAEKAVENHLPASSLKVAMETGVIITPPDKTPGILTFELVAMQFERVLKQMAPKLARISDEERARLARLFRPVVKFVEEMES